MTLYEFADDLISDIAELETVQAAFVEDFGQLLAGKDIDEELRKHFTILLFVGNSMATRLENLEKNAMFLFEYERELNHNKGKDA